jgi:hypothetical protein
MLRKVNPKGPLSRIIALPSKRHLTSDRTEEAYQAILWL